MEQKIFLWKDKSGRDFRNTLTEEELIIAFQDDTNYDGETISEWLDNNPIIGDEWENEANKIICL
jgi:hypothetical protein